MTDVELEGLERMRDYLIDQGQYGEADDIIARIQAEVREMPEGMPEYPAEPEDGTQPCEVIYVDFKTKKITLIRAA